MANVVFDGSGHGDWIWRDRDACDGLTHRDLVREMVAEAREQGFEPFDFSYPKDRTPNIYLRGVYEVDEDGTISDRCVGDRFMMPVRPIRDGA